MLARGADIQPPAPRRPAVRAEAEYLQLSTTATILIASQAPGSENCISRESPFPTRPATGCVNERGFGTDIFYDESQGRHHADGLLLSRPSRRGGDAPPRTECVDLWRNRLLRLLPAVRLTLLVAEATLSSMSLGLAQSHPRVKKYVILSRLLSAPASVVEIEIW